MTKKGILLLLLAGLVHWRAKAQTDTVALRRQGEDALSKAQDLKQHEKFDSAAPYYEKALTIFRARGDKQGISSALTAYAEVKMVQAQLPAAEDMLKESIRLLKETGDARLQWQYGLLGAIETQRRESVEALKDELQAIRIGEQYGDTSSHMAEIYNYTAIIYNTMGRLDEAGDYVQKAIATGSHSIDPMLAVQFRSNLANILIQQNKLHEALENLLVVRRSYGSSLPLDARLQLLSRFVRCYVALKDSASARMAANELIRYSDSLRPDEYNQLIICTQLNRYLLWSRQYEKARRFAEKQLLAGEKFKLPEQRMQAFSTLSKIDSASGNMTAALHYFELYAGIKDSTSNVNIANQLNQLHVEYETEKKDKELVVKQKNIELLQKNNRIQEMALEKAAFIRNVIIAGALGLGLMSALVYSRYRMKKRASEEMALQREEIRQKNVALEALIGDKDKLLAEKEWLVKEVHHRVKNNLQMVISLLNSQSAYLSNEDAVAAIKESQRRMQAMSLIHERLYEKDEAAIDMPTYISDLIAYLKDSFDKENVEIVMKLEPLVLDVSKAVPVGLILNEAITNALKYAFPNDRAANDRAADGRPGKILISLSTTASLAELVVADDGIGLPAGDAGTSRKSLGMSLMKGLTAQIGGTYAITGEKGVKITISFSPAQIGTSVT